MNRKSTTSPKESPVGRLASTLRDILHQTDGTLTRDLVRSPGRFGLGQVPQKLAPDRVTDMVCGFCATGCSLRVHLRDGEAVNLTPTTLYPVNLGMACPKGWEALSVLDSPDRATIPLLRDRVGQTRADQTRALGWEEALQVFCERMKGVAAEHGPESIAVLSTGQMPSEEMALLGSLAKFGMGIVHCDSNTRQCMATAVAAYKESFGFDAPPYTYQDLEESDVIVLVGSNLCIGHPIMWERVCRNRHEPKIVVVDPRRTETAMAACLHLPIAPKSDLTFFYAIAHILIRDSAIDRAYIDANTSGFEQFTSFVQEYTPERAAEASGIGVEAIEELARIIRSGKRVSFWWTMGVNQSYEGTRVAQSLINLALMTGSMGRPGTGANSVTGQCNAMGSRQFSATSSLFAGRDFTSAAHRGEVAQILGIAAEAIPAVNSWPYHKIMEGIREGSIKALWVVCTNTAHSWVDQHEARELLGKLDFLVVQDMYHSTDTARLADLLFPAAGWGEKEGTFINSERRVGVIKRVRKPPGEALPDFAIFRLIAESWGCGEMFERWSSPEAAFEILKELTRGRPCDLTGVGDYAQIDHAGGVQWPCVGPPQAAAQQRRLFEDGRFYHPDGRARFVWEASRSMPEAPDAQYPYLLLTGRGGVAQWHTQTRTAKSPILRKLYPEGVYVEMHPADAASAGIAQRSLVEVASRRGRLEATAVLTPTIQRGQAFIPMHYEATNRLTLPHFDPYSHQPSYKDCAVRIEPLKPLP